MLVLQKIPRVHRSSQEHPFFEVAYHQEGQDQPVLQKSSIQAVETM